MPRLLGAVKLGANAPEINKYIKLPITQILNFFFLLSLDAKWPLLNPLMDSMLPPSFFHCQHITTSTKELSVWRYVINYVPRYHAQYYDRARTIANVTLGTDIRTSGDIG